MPAEADCNQLSERISVGDASSIEVLGTSGSLRITGYAGTDEVVAQGEACTDEDDRLAEIQILTERVGDRIRIIAAVPFEDEREEWRIGHLDLEVEVPDSLPLVVSDSSGDLRIRSVSSLQLTDSSGDVEIENVPGEVVVVVDSSGDLEIRDVGRVTIRIDTSGDIFVGKAESVSIGEDTSGDIEIRDVRGDVTIGNDTSGSISARNVGGNFEVTNDSSGDIHAQEIAGETRIPEQY